MLYRIISKETKRFLRDDFIFDQETEEAIEAVCPEGFSWPMWDGEQWVEGGGVFESQAVATADGEALEQMITAIVGE